MFSAEHTNLLFSQNKFSLTLKAPVPANVVVDEVVHVAFLEVEKLSLHESLLVKVTLKDACS